MKIIIVIQSLIILAAAYYIYTLSRPVTVEESVMPTDRLVAPAIIEGYIPPTGNPPVDEQVPEPAVSSDITGPSDAGMEYPVMDEDVELQVQ